MKDVVMCFNQTVLLDRLNLTIEEGETVVICGPSGTGKSVILKLCVGLMSPSSGQILIEGENICDMSDRELDAMRMKTGMLFQNYGLFDSMTVAENVAFILSEHTRLSQSEIKDRVKGILEQVGLENVEHLKPVELSGGMKKRVGIARALVHNPRIVYFDEPVAGLDPVTSDRINDLILELSERFRMTSLVVSNNISCAAKIGDRIGMLYQGNFVEIDASEKIINSTHPVVYQFVRGLEEGPIQMH
ncbi:ATP-binding cassette domain-containing protein [bacterium]|nr:ATP-binding cassette domain-containing protein [bacterium]